MGQELQQTLSTLVVFEPLMGQSSKISKTYFMHWLRMSMRTSQRKEKKPIFMHEGKPQGRSVHSLLSVCAKTAPKLDSVIKCMNLFSKRPAKPLFILTSVTVFSSCS